MKKILITGAAGFIGFHLALACKKRGNFVIGIDNFNAYYDVALKKEREKILSKNDISILNIDILQQSELEKLLLSHNITHVVHLAAQAGVRHSFNHPEDYIASNINGFSSLMETLRKFPDVYLVYASSSSVYGTNKKTPFHEDDKTDHPANLYGATKKSNEVMAASYRHLYNIRSTGLRYFTVFGPWGRPDMAYFFFAKSIIEKKEIPLFNRGQMRRDFTYIDDIVDGTIAAIDKESDFEVFNLGNSKPIDLMLLVQTLESFLGQKANIKMLPMQPGELLETYADIHKSRQALNYSPKIPFNEGMKRFVEWFKEFYLLEAAIV
ncbi:MAG: protein CapI [Chlamydiae bacterium CG10_big_fil_rev_8_21_14_0_10_35_9]|nr:MAG: protein CapI [Chlamydiae bacterium CG10_big_fil_rev_8_21_14_0_10_35_9]